MKRNENTVRKFWSYISNQNFTMVGSLMEKNVVVKLANTREKFVRAEDFVRFNEKYPGNWKASIEKLFSIKDVVISVVKLEDAEQPTSYYVTSFFVIRDNLITELTEYYGDNGEPPAWRVEQSLSERY